MKFFKLNKIFLDNETLAEQLRRARQAKKLKLEEVAKKLKINYKYLAALEKGEYDKLPKGIYGKNFLREYALFLGLNYRELGEVFNEEKKIFEPHDAKELFSRQVVKKTYFWLVPKIVRNIIIALIILICFLYLGFRLNKIISPPSLFIYSPIENFSTNQHTVNVSGKTEPETQLNINGESVLSDLNGNFSKLVNLKNGINTIIITATKKYGRDKTITRQVLVKSE